MSRTRRHNPESVQPKLVRQLAYVVVEAAVVQLERLVRRHRSDPRRKIMLGGRTGAAHEHRNDGHSELNGGGHLAHHVVIGLEEARTSLRIGDGRPLRSDHDDQSPCLLDAAADNVAEVGAGRNPVTIEEDLGGPELLPQARGEPASVAGLVVVPIGDEYARVWTLSDTPRGQVTRPAAGHRLDPRARSAAPAAAAILCET
jgi:hypothetical protein